jgi:aminoglycoside/choline kinase family phosphotransferase
MTDLRRAGVTINGFASVHPTAAVSRGAVLTDAVVWEGCRLGPRARVESAVLGTAVRAQGPVKRLACTVASAGNPRMLAAVSALGWTPEKSTASPFPPRGSSRTFTRICSGTRSIVFVEYGLDRPENGLYVRHARFLRKLGVRVPEIIRHDPAEQTIVLEDAGDTSLQDRVGGSTRSEVLDVYRKVLDVAALLHRSGRKSAERSGTPLSEPFSPTVYRWERNLFETHVLDGILPCRESRQRRNLAADLKSVAHELSRLPRVLIHRDLQASNVLLYRGKPVLLDFQGMRLGPAAYDVASLLCDPYVFLPEQVQNMLILYYARQTGQDEDRFIEAFWRGAVQRLVQALGAYGRLSATAATARFRGYIVPGLRMLVRAARRSGDLPHLRAWLATALPEARRRLTE